MRELWTFESGKHRYWCPTHVTPEPGVWVVYVQKDTETHRSCSFGAARLVRFDLRERVVRDWPGEWSAAAKLSLEAALGEALDRRHAA